MSTRTRKDVILWGALGCALVSTAHAEYTLATAAHFNEYVALAVPGALDLYVIRALQERRDVFVAVLAMVAANVASHLIVAGVLPVGWPVVSAVGAVAPLIVWRVYSLKYTRTRQELLWGTRAGTDPAAPGAVSAPDEYDAPEAHPDEGPRSEYGYPPVPDHVPGHWMDDEYPETYPSASVPEWDDEHFLPPSAADAVHSVELRDTDWPFVEAATRYVDDVANPSVRGIRKALNIGQDRAERLLAYLEVKS